MFNFEETISEWRRQMLAAGIQAPVPLEELEIHLREEIERHTRSGLNEAEAFEAAAEKIGQAQVLQKEFKKVEKDHKIMRPILLIIGWLAASCILYYSVLIWELDWNWWGFSPRGDIAFSCAMLGIFLALLAIWFLAKASRDQVSRVVSLLVCVLLAGLALMWLHDGKNASGFFGGHYVVPLWYRAVRTLPLCVPGIFWVWWLRRHLGQQRSPTNRSQPIHSA